MPVQDEEEVEDGEISKEDKEAKRRKELQDAEAEQKVRLLTALGTYVIMRHHFPNQ